MVFWITLIFIVLLVGLAMLLLAEQIGRRLVGSVRPPEDDFERRGIDPFTDREGERD